MDKFLSLSFRFLDRCEELTLNRTPTMGTKVPRTIAALETTLYQLHQFATCAESCEDGNHVLERLAGRVFASTEGSLRLGLFGLYDESLSLTRSVGEIANILFLFVNDDSARERWFGASEADRKRHFSPVKVRLALERAAPFVPVEESRYSSLCEVAVHATPATSPQSHNPLGIPTLGGHFQDAGFLVSLNELAYVLALSAISISSLSARGGKKQEQLAKTGVALLREIGSVTIENVDDVLRHIGPEREA